MMSPVQEEKALFSEEEKKTFKHFNTEDFVLLWGLVKN